MPFFRRVCVAIACCISATANSTRADSFGSGATQFDIEFVTIGDPGNAPDLTSLPWPAGSVDREFRLGKYEVSRDAVLKASLEGDLQLSILGGASLGHPAIDLPWNEVARFVNWLNVDQGYHPAYKFGLQPGEAGYVANADVLEWQPGDPGYDSSNPLRNQLAQYYLPTLDEWFKAGYFDPTGVGPEDGYWFYPSGSDTPPKSVTGGVEDGTAVYCLEFTQGANDVMNAGGLNQYGLMAMAGNVNEWLETEFVDSPSPTRTARWVKGGDWSNCRFDMNSTARGLGFQDSGSVLVGFRVASVPEPSSWAICLAVAGFACFSRKRWAA